MKTESARADRITSGTGDVPKEQSSRRPRAKLATDTVVQHLEQLIFQGELDPGDSLPSESELAALLDLSRLTVREAIRSLQARGLVEVAHGRRPIVAHPNARPLADFFSASVRRDSRSLLELVELRLATEVHTAELAALQATNGDLSAIAAQLETMRAVTDDEAAFNDADVRFHSSIAAASGNRMLMLLLEGMDGPLHLSRLESIRGHRERHAGLDELIEQHAEIYRRILDRDARGAASAMRRHLLQTRKDLRAAFSVAAPKRA